MRLQPGPVWYHVTIAKSKEGVGDSVQRSLGVALGVTERTVPSHQAQVDQALQGAHQCTRRPGQACPQFVGGTGGGCCCRRF